MTFFLSRTDYNKIKPTIKRQGNIMKIYIDVLIITNTIAELICLESASRIIHTAVKNRRLFSASFLGGLTSLLVIPSANTYSVALMLTLLKLFSIPLIALTAFGFKSIKHFVKGTLVLMLTKVVFTGITLVVWELSDTKRIYVRNYTFYFDISLLKLTIVIIATYILLTTFDVIKKICEKDKTYRAVYRCGNYSLCIPAVADTGNKLTDRFTNTPVVIFYCDDLYFHYGLDSPESFTVGKFRLMPFETINGKGLIAVTSNGEIEIADDKHRFTQLRCCVGVTRSNGSDPRAIFDPKIIC